MLVTSRVLFRRQVALGEAPEVTFPEFLSVEVEKSWAYEGEIGDVWTIKSQSGQVA